MEASKEYIAQCLESLTVGSRLFPEAARSSAARPAVLPVDVVSIDSENLYAVVTGKSRGTRLLSGRRLAMFWTWKAKPPVPIPEVKAEATNEHNNGHRNIGNMWLAIKNLQAEVAKLKADLGQ
jgi:hypothetical protein